MALDYSIVLLTIEELWTALGGNLMLYGFVFGIYALSQSVITPLLGYISDVRGLKFTLLLSLVLNALGNVLYVFAFVSNSVNMILIGRFVSGLGAGSLVLGVVYLTNVSSRDMRGKVIASFKLSQAVGYFGGPMIGMAFMTLNAPEKTSSTTTKIFNLYTLPAWVALGNVIFIVIPAVKYCFKNPLSPHMALKYNHKEARELVIHTLILIPLLFLATSCYWVVTSDLFTLAFGQYHLLTSNRNLWKVYVSAGVTLILSCVFVRVTIHRIRKMSSEIFTVIGLLFASVGFLLLIDYGIQNTLLSKGFYYGGVAFVISGGASFFTGIGTYFSRKVTDLSHQARNRRGLFLGLFTFAESFGRFVGPTTSSLILFVEENPKIKSIHKCDLINLIPDGCHVSNINVTMAVLCSIIVILTACFVFYHRRYGKCQVDISLLSLEELTMPEPGQGRLWSRVDNPSTDDVNIEFNLELTPPRSRTVSRVSTNSMKSSQSNSLNNNTL
jgi:MFS family permease